MSALLLTAALLHAAGPREPVVLLHGLGRSSASMSLMGVALRAAGFEVCNIAYPSRRHSIETLAREHVAPQVARCFPGHGAPLHFVTHSLGGILVRELARRGEGPRIGRVVMLAPPNGGTELVDRLGAWPGFGWINGPAGYQLGTGAGSVPKALGPAPFECGVIAGERSINPVLSLLLPGADDGKVSVARTRLDGMRDFAVVESTHTFIMNSPAAIARTVRFLRTGAFAAQRFDSPATNVSIK